MYKSDTAGTNGGGKLSKVWCRVLLHHLSEVLRYDEVPSMWQKYVFHGSNTSNMFKHLKTIHPESLQGDGKKTATPKAKPPTALLPLPELCWRQCLLLNFWDYGHNLFLHNTPQVRKINTNSCSLLETDVGFSNVYSIFCSSNDAKWYLVCECIYLSGQLVNSSSKCNYGGRNIVITVY